jgi:formylglycine-generating enzyme required for sulfatase activity
VRRHNPQHRLIAGPARWWLLAWFMLGLNIAAAADVKIALVIGNSEYPNGPLPNPANDAKMMGDTLSGLGFDVILRRNADQNTMKRAIEDFGSRLEKAGGSAVGLFYYAGHGAQLNGRNYLIPITARIEREGDMEIEAVSADWVIEQMRYARNRLNIVILDACRNNPFTRSMRSVDRGLATMDAPAGILIAYSTAPGSVAQDGNGHNSPYTEALSQAMRNQREPVEQLFKHVRVAVMGNTDGKQVPWESSSLTGDFYFTPPASAPAATMPAPAPTVAMLIKPAPVTAPATTPAARVPAPPPQQSAPSGPIIAGTRALPWLQTLGIEAGEINAAGSYPQSVLRQRVESAPRHVRLGSTAEQIQAAYTLCQKYSSGCQLSWYSDENVRKVTLAPFALDAAPVTVSAFRQFANASQFKTSAETAGYAYAMVEGNLQPVSGGSWRNAVLQHAATDESAVVGVSFRDAEAYCQAKNERLPTEDEWEYVARGPERHVFGWGDDVGPASSAGGNRPRATDGPAEGIGGRYRGLTGNVWQWVDTTVGDRKVLKGGSWLEPSPANKRAAARRYELSRRADEDSGFRCARTVAAWPDAELWLSQLK